MSGDQLARPCGLAWKADCPGVVGARWWRGGMEVAALATSRRSALKIIVATGIGVIGIAALIEALSDDDPTSGSGGGSTARGSGGGNLPSEARDATAAQREFGWNVGADGESVAFPDAVPADVSGKTFDAAAPLDLSATLQPVQERLQPFQVPTLFQMADAPSNAAFRSALTPIRSTEMRDAFDRGEAVRTLFEGSTGGADTAIVVDLAGPESVAFAAALAPAFAPVFTFDNWPHPRGVVPAHLTLAAALYHAPDFAAATHAPDAAPVFVLDRNRLNAYVDASNRFDNRYLAKMPSAAALKGLGIKHVLYVCPGGGTLVESDDLNDDFVAWHEGGIDVKILPTSDLKQGNAAEPPPAASQPAPGTAAPNTVVPAQPAYYRETRIYHHYYWGGSPWYHPWFWNSYGWRPMPYWAYPMPHMYVPYGYGYLPRPRVSMYSSGRGVTPPYAARPRPGGFGRVFVAPSGSSHVGGTSVNPRSGSLNRTTGSSSFGG